MGVIWTRIVFERPHSAPPASELLSTPDVLPPTPDSNRSLRKRNRSLDGSRSRFRILKNHRAETRSEFRRLRCQTPEFLRQRPGSWPLTYGNVATPVSARNPWGETGVTPHRQRTPGFGEQSA